jgi:hypothetical protein
MQLDMLCDCEVKSIELFSILAYLASDDRVALLPKSRAFSEKVQEIGARLYQLVEKFFTQLPEIHVFPGIFDIVEPYLTRKEAARGDMERTMWTNLIRYFIDSNFLIMSIIVSYGIGVAPSKDKNGKRMEGKFCTFQCRPWILITALRLIKPPSIWLDCDHPNVGIIIIIYCCKS